MSRFDLYFLFIIRTKKSGFDMKVNDVAPFTSVVKEDKERFKQRVESLLDKLESKSS